MAITSITQQRQGNLTEVTATSDLVAAAGEQLTFHWYNDGRYLGPTTTGTRSFLLEPGEQVRVEALDTLDPDFDPLASAPAGYPARRTLWWVRSLAASCAEYQVEQQEAGGDWTAIARVAHDPNRWSYAMDTAPLLDRTLYAWRVTPLDELGNAGTPVSLGSETVIRRPDAPGFTIEVANIGVGSVRVQLLAA